VGDYVGDITWHVKIQNNQPMDTHFEGLVDTVPILIFGDLEF